MRVDPICVLCGNIERALHMVEACDWMGAIWLGILSVQSDSTMDSTLTSGLCKLACHINSQNWPGRSSRR